MAKWDGMERRQNGERYIDLLIRIDANLENMMKEFNLHMEDFRRHKHDDILMVEKINRDINNLFKIVWTANGFVIAIVVIFNVFFNH